MATIEARDNACGVVACLNVGFQKSEADGFQPSTSRPTAIAQQHRSPPSGMNDQLGHYWAGGLLCRLQAQLYSDIGTR